MSNDFLPFATGVGANVASQATYAAASSTGQGYQSGVAPSALFNKSWRQATFVAAAVATLIVNELGISVNDDGNLTNFVTNLTAAIQQAAGAAAASNGQCYFQLNGSNGQLVPKNGNRLIINGAQAQIPLAGVFLAPTGLTAATFYYVYAANFSQNVTGAANNGSGNIRLALASTANEVTGNTLTVSGVVGTTEANGTWIVTVIDATHVDLQGSTFTNAYVSGGTATGLVLLASTTGHSTSSSGVETMTGDATKSLVGAVYTNTGPAFADADGQRWLISWFNQKRKRSRTTFTAPRTTASASYVELNSEIRNSFITWGTQEVGYSATGTMENGTNGDGTQTAVGFDGTTPEFETSDGISGIANMPYAVVGQKNNATEGQHYATLLGAVVAAGTGTWIGGTVANGGNAALNVYIMG